MPKRSQSQRIGDQAELIVRTLIDNHTHWLARGQDHDFGIDLEAEFAQPDDKGNQQLSGKLIKIQIKGSRSWPIQNECINVVLRRGYLDYINQFRLPALLVAVDVTTRDAWFVWLQDWMLRHEESLLGASAPTATIAIPVAHTLRSGLNDSLQGISRGEHETAMVLGLRELGIAAISARNSIVFEKVLDILSAINESSKAWIAHKTIDALIGMGPHVGVWETHALLPLLFTLIDRVGDQLSPSQIGRLVRRDDTYSRTSIYALSRLYDRWPDHGRALSLPMMFDAEGLEPVAWYCRLREHYRGETSLGLFDRLQSFRLPRAHFGSLRLPNSPAFASDLLQRWPNRGDSYYLDRLQLAEPTQREDIAPG
jgi:hypothetical protein